MSGAGSPPARGGAPGIVLGECAFARPGFARFDPLLRLGPAGWERVLEAAQDYPDEGKIFCRDPRTFAAAQGSLWVFAVEPNPRFDPASKARDRLMAQSASPATKVIDLSACEWEEARQRVVEAGFPPAFGEFDEAYVLLSGDACVRLRFAADPRDGARRAVADDLSELPVLRCDGAIAAGARVAGVAYLIPGREPQRVLDRVDWSPDEEFLPRTLRRVKRAGFGDAGALTNSAVEALTSFLKSRGAMPGEEPSLRRMRRRLEDFLPRFRPADDHVEAMVAAIEAHRPVSSAMAQALAERRLALEQELRPLVEAELLARLEADHAAAARRVKVASERAAEAEARRTEAEASAAAAQARAAALEGALAEEVSSLREALAAAPACASGRAQAIARSVSAALGGAAGDEVVPSASPPWARARATAAPAVGLDRIGERLAAEAHRAGVNEADLLALDALLRGGEMVVLLGSGSADALAAYARCVSGGDTVLFGLDPSVIGLDDLWRQPGTGAPTALARAWTVARSTPAATVLLVLAALDATPFEFWLAPFSEVLRSGDRPRNLLVASTVASSRCAGRLPCEEFVRFALPFAASDADPTRSALRATGRHRGDAATAYDGSGAPAPDQGAVASFVSNLADTRVDGGPAAARATRAFVSAQATHAGDAATSLALDVAAVASGGEARAGTALALGLDRLRALLRAGGE